MSADFAWGVLAAFVFLAAAIAVTAAVWDLPRDGIDLGDDPAEPSPLATWQDSREAYRNVRVLPQASDPVTLTHYLVGDKVIDLRGGGIVGTFGHGSPDVETCIHCGQVASHACDLDDFIAHNTRTPRDDAS